MLQTKNRWAEMNADGFIQFVFVVLCGELQTQLGSGWIIHTVCHLPALFIQLYLNCFKCLIALIRLDNMAGLDDYIKNINWPMVGEEQTVVCVFWENLISMSRRPNRMIDMWLCSASGPVRGTVYNRVLSACVCLCVQRVCVMSGVISIRLVYLRDQIRWISCSLTQMFIWVSDMSYVSRCRFKLALLSDSLAWFKCCREETSVCVCVCCRILSAVRKAVSHLRRACRCVLDCRYRPMSLDFSFRIITFSTWPIITSPFFGP